ncbi:MAG: copper homeostasis protein CutC [Acetobacteraceae bacterium]|nr:copper homeostasis protein CutC [Acetobacteraceae bacterium]
MEPLIEICVEGIDGLLAAERGGADRVELCASLLEGGITPSLATVREARRRASVPFHAMVRPRGGDFLYSEAEFATMLEDVALFCDAGAQGVVIGCLHPDGTVDVERTGALVEHAHPASVTFHRAFDMTRDPFAALEALIACGVDRVLTSGQRPTATEGLALLRELRAREGERITVLGCGALDERNIAHVRRETGLRELHFSAPHEAASPMQFRNLLAMGGVAAEREYRLTLTDAERVARTIAAARSA